MIEEKIELWQSHHAMLKKLCEMFKPKSYLEVGVQEGNSMKIVVANSPIERLTLCDTWGGMWGGTGKGSHAHIEQILKRMEFSGKVTFLDGYSHSEIPKLDESETFDLITVDGDHSYQGAMVDLENCFKRLNPNGLLVFDDTVSHPPLYNCSLDFLNKTKNCRLAFADNITPAGVVVFQRV